MCVWCVCVCMYMLEFLDMSVKRMKTRKKLQEMKIYMYIYI